MQRCILLCLNFLLAGSLTVKEQLAPSVMNVAQQAGESADPRKKLPGFERALPEERRAMAELESLYGNPKHFWDVQSSLCGKCVSSEDQDSIMKANREKSWSAGIYGEIKPYSVMQLLKKLRVKPEQKYYDLGSGAGKTVLIAAQLFGMNATGVELSKDRHDAACEALRSLQKAWSKKSSQARGEGTVEFMHASFFDVDFSDADIVFMDSVEFTDEMMARLAYAARSLKPGTRIVSWRELPSSSDYNEGDEIPLDATWGNFTIRVFEKTSEPTPPTHVRTVNETETCYATRHRH